jgi:glycosyltransferase involved in cell wall biosynthesis
VFTGHPDERARSMQNLADNLGIAANVKFLGHVSETELSQLYSKASCMVFPSLHEGFGIPIVEAMSFGLPVICGRDASIPEVAGQAVLYADMRNPLKLAGALLKVAQDEKLRQELAARSRERMKTFDLSGEVRLLSDLFAVAVARPKVKKHPQFLRQTKLAAAYHIRSLGRKVFESAVSIPLLLERWCATMF